MASWTIEKLRYLQSVGGLLYELCVSVVNNAHNWAIFSVLYYFVFPRLPAFSSVADPMNSVAYLLGGIAAYVCWQFYYLLPI